MKYSIENTGCLLKLGIRKSVKESRIEDKETDGHSVTFSNSSRKNGGYRSSEESNSLFQGKSFVRAAHGEVWEARQVITDPVQRGGSRGEVSSKQ